MAGKPYPISTAVPSRGDSKASLHLLEEKYLLLALIACVEEIIWVASSGDMESRIDPSAGPYTSRYEEERQLLDREFLAATREVQPSGGHGETQ